MSVAETLAAHARGEISPHIALARLILAGEKVDAPMLAGAPEVAALAERHRARIPQLMSIAGRGVSNHDSLTSTAALFDALAGESPEAAVAFYSLGDAAELSLATAELLKVIEDWSPGARRRVIDVGCGIGRLAIPLAEEGHRVLGLDLSAGMLDEARRRAGNQARLSFALTDGVTLPAPDAGADLVLVADCMPYLVDAGEDERFVVEAARVLAPGGDLLVFNWSYRGDPARDIEDARRLASEHGFALVRAGERPFRIWDGAGFQLRRAA